MSIRCCSVEAVLSPGSPGGAKETAVLQCPQELGAAVCPSVAVGVPSRRESEPGLDLLCAPAPFSPTKLGKGF